MTKDDIIRMAADSGMELYGLGKNRERFVYHFECFANMIAAHQREKVAQWMISHDYAIGHGDTIEGLLTELALQVDEEDYWGQKSAKAIRARGQA